MRHRKHNHLLGVKTAHRTSLIANLSCSLIDNGRIKTTLAKARALRPAIEKAITLAKKAHSTEDIAKKVHLRRQAIARLRNKAAVTKLFDELVEQFDGRNGGYTRIYKLAIPRLGDAAEMAIIEFVEEIQKKKTKKKRASKKIKQKSEKSDSNKSPKDEGEKSDESIPEGKADIEESDTKKSVERSPQDNDDSSDSETDQSEIIQEDSVPEDKPNKSE